MQIIATEFQLQGCRCRLKFDPKELQQLLVQRLEGRFAKDKKLKNSDKDTMSVSGRFLEIDEGNLALHIMLAFLGKPKIACEAEVKVDDKILWKEPIEFSTSGTCFHSMRALLKSDIDLLANDILKRTTKALKNKQRI